MSGKGDDEGDEDEGEVLVVNRVEDVEVVKVEDDKDDGKERLMKVGAAIFAAAAEEEVMRVTERAWASALSETSPTRRNPIEFASDLDEKR